MSTNKVSNQNLHKYKPIQKHWSSYNFGHSFLNDMNGYTMLPEVISYVSVRYVQISDPGYPVGHTGSIHHPGMVASNRFKWDTVSVLLF